MFVTDFFFSFFLLAFTGILMVGGAVLLVDAFRRMVLEVYKNTRQTQAVAPQASPLKADGNVQPFEPAA